VQHVETLGTEHVTEEYVRASEALDFVADPFAGKPAVTTGASIPAAPVEPAPVTTPMAPPAPPATCRSGRRLTLHVRRLRAVGVSVDGRAVAVPRHGKITEAAIGLSGYPRQTVAVRVTGRMKHGKRVVQVHRYHPCTPSGRST
jgi:hypothetical protein